MEEAVHSKGGGWVYEPRQAGDPRGRKYKETDSPLEPADAQNLAEHFRTSGSQNSVRIHWCGFKHLVCGSFHSTYRKLKQQEQTQSLTQEETIDPKKELQAWPV